ncbi:Uncharacterised protein [uncultured Clostridium sp.]|nr:Uncharacterised protein [uncultured Clostridium sp.]SCI83438.1 Uncharacterised protein [uncultured Clostridium sp.]
MENIFYNIVGFIKDIFINFQDYILGFGDMSVALIVGLLAYKVSLNNNKYKVARERLEKAYYPLFRELEPNLYKDINLEDWNRFRIKFNSIDSKHELLIEPHLRDMVNITDKVINGKHLKKDRIKHFNIVCRIIEKDYDLLCSLSHMPKRNLYYIIDNKQFRSIPHAIFTILKVFGMPLLFFFFAATLVFKIT